MKDEEKNPEEQKTIKIIRNQLSKRIKHRDDTIKGREDVEEKRLKIPSAKVIEEKIEVSKDYNSPFQNNEKDKQHIVCKVCY